MRKNYCAPVILADEIVVEQGIANSEIQGTQASNWVAGDDDWF